MATNSKPNGDAGRTGERQVVVSVPLGCLAFQMQEDATPEALEWLGIAPRDARKVFTGNPNPQPIYAKGSEHVGSAARVRSFVGEFGDLAQISEP